METGWRILVDPEITVLLASATPKVASRNFIFVKTLLENHIFAEPLRKFVKGNFTNWSETKWSGGQWNAQQIQFPGQQEPAVTLLALTSKNVRFTGIHCDLIINDDLLTEETVTSESAFTTVSYTHLTLPTKRIV